MRNTQIGLTAEFPYCIRDNEVYCSTLCYLGVWDRSPLDINVKAFRTKESAEKYRKLKGISGWVLIPYKEWEETEAIKIKEEVLKEVFKE